MSKKTANILVQIIGWGAFFVAPILFFPKPEEPTFSNNTAIKFGLSNVLLIAFYYFNYYYAVPKIFFLKKYFRYFLAIFVSFIFIVLVLHSIDYFVTPISDQLGLPKSDFFEELFRKPPPDAPPPRDGGRFGFMLSLALRFVIVLALSVSSKLIDRIEKIEKEKETAELSYLKAQINPHFLFNTLNGIYTLALKKSDDTAEAVVKLSNIMRYVISEATHDYVPLDKEIQYITDYIDLQKIRMSKTTVIDFQVKGSLEDKKIVPLLFIPFIENAFNYGISTEIVSEIKIYATVSKKAIDFFVMNHKLKQQKVENKSTGLGIPNTKQRLQLVYPNNHELIIIDNETVFSVSLKINLI